MSAYTPTSGSRDVVQSGYTPPATPPATPTPTFDLATHFGLPTRTGVRLHPRGGCTADAFASKLGGTPAWPAREAWPWCAEYGEPMLPVLQLRRADVGELPFPPGADVFQLVWCPEFHAPRGCLGPRAVVRWRAAAAVGATRAPPRPSAPFPTADHVPSECVLIPERVREVCMDALHWHPRAAEMERAVRERCAADFERMLVPRYYREMGNLYGTPRSTKVGGFSGMDGAPECAGCGRVMAFLLTSPRTSTSTATRTRATGGRPATSARTMGGGSG